MKRDIYIILLLIIITGNISAQQFPFMEGYTVDAFHLSPSYAGLTGSGILFIDHRTDWTGIPDGPKTYQLSYHDRFFEKVGIGGRLIYDKTDIFKQFMLLGTYTYEVTVAKEHLLNFGLSSGFYRNSIDLGKYYSDPDYVDDLVLTYGTEKSRIKFTSDISVLYRFKKIEAGILFSNVMFGTSYYKDADLTYKPLKNYVIHASYQLDINEQFSTQPFILIRGGKNVPVQIEGACQLVYKDMVWGNLLYRTGGIFGIGIGGEIKDNFILNYSYNLSSNIDLSTFGSHQITLGVRLMPFIESIF